MKKLLFTLLALGSVGSYASSLSIPDFDISEMKCALSYNELVQNADISDRLIKRIEKKLILKGYEELLEEKSQKEKGIIKLELTEIKQQQQTQCQQSYIDSICPEHIRMGAQITLDEKVMKSFSQSSKETTFMNPFTGYFYSLISASRAGALNKLLDSIPNCEEMKDSVYRNL